MERPYSLLLIVILAGGGWYFTAGPGAGKLGAILTTAVQAPNGGGTTPAATNATPGAQLAPDPGSNPAIPAAPNVASPQPMFGGPAIRIGSFNIKDFGDTKAAKPYVMATLASIIHNFHVVAIQEISTQDNYLIDNFLRNFVNQNGRVYDRIVGPRLGRSFNTEQYAFLYDTAAIEVNRRMVYTVHDPDDLLHREPLVAMFRVRGPPPQHAFTFVLVNIHTDPDETDTELDALGQVYQVVRRTSGGEDDIILLGDLNVDDQHLGELGRLDGVRPVVRNVPTNTRGTELYDNIIFHQPSTAEYSGRWGVYNFPHTFKLNLEQALQVSDHLPIWAEFSVYESATPGRVASRPQGTIGAQ